MLTEALAAYPAAIRSLAWTPLGSAGGLSGASLYRGDGPAGPLFALKIWPAGWDTGQLHRMRAAMRAARGRGCEFVLRIVPPAEISGVGRRVDVTDWVPGVPAESPSDAKFQALGDAMARLHRVSEIPGIGSVPGLAPAVERRLTALAKLPPAWRELGAQSLARLAPYRDRRGQLVVTHGDLRADHALFVGDHLSGIIDFGACKLDHPAADLARYAADIGPSSVEPLCAAYEAAGGVAVSRDFVAALAFSGLVVAAARWAGLPGDAAAARSRERLAKLQSWRG